MKDPRSLRGHGPTQMTSNDGELGEVHVPDPMCNLNNGLLFCCFGAHKT